MPRMSSEYYREMVKKYNSEQNIPRLVYRFIKGYGIGKGRNSGVRSCDIYNSLETIITYNQRQTYEKTYKPLFKKEFENFIKQNDFDIIKTEHKFETFKDYQTVDLYLNIKDKTSLKIVRGNKTIFWEKGDTDFSFNGRKGDSHVMLLDTDYKNDTIKISYLKIYDKEFKKMVDLDECKSLITKAIRIVESYGYIKRTENYTLGRNRVFYQALK